MTEQEALVEIARQLKRMNDRAEPKHGRWIKVGDSSWECSICHEVSCCNGNYCVDCGADMREVEE